MAAFYEPERVGQWWGGDLMSEPREDGTYVVHFPQLGQTMRGEVRAYEPDRLLAFTWAWDHEPDAPDLTVSVRVGPTPEGTRLEIEHGPYTDTAIADAASHQEGWNHFLPRLARHLSD